MTSGATFMFDGPLVDGTLVALEFASNQRASAMVNEVNAACLDLLVNGAQYRLRPWRAGDGSTPIFAGGGSRWTVT